MIKIGFVQPNFSVGPIASNAYFFPYSVGVLISYLRKQNVDFTVTDIIFKRNLIADAATRLENSDIVGFSTYVWNKEYNYKLAEELKRRNPDILTVFGGPEVPSTDVNIFQKHPYIDLVATGEGEENFLKLIQSFDSRSFYQVPGLIINKSGFPITNKAGERIQNIDDIPSPYLTGVFDNLIAQNPEVNWSVSLETNRGCPYQCTFCDWGSLTYSKVKKFDIDRVFEEVDWIGRNGIRYVYMADANVGIFGDRDELIMDRMMEARQKYGAPIGVTMSYAKNQKSSVVNIAKKLIENKFDHGLTVSLQTLTESVLEIIKRKNLEINKAQEIFELCRENGIPVNVELILGLPGETVESWKDTFYKLVRLGNKIMTVYQCQSLENSEMNLSQTDEYDIKSIISYNSLGNASADDEVLEGLPIVVSTKHMPLESMVDANLWNWFFFTFHVEGLSNFVSEYLERENIVSYEEFYKELFDIVLADSTLRQEYETRRSQIFKWLTTGKDQSEFLGEVRLEGIKLYSYGTSCKIHVDKELRKHVQSLVADYVKKFSDDDVMSDLLSFQQTYLVDLEDIDVNPKRYSFKYNWLDYFVHKEELKKELTDIDFFNKATDEVLRSNLNSRSEFIWYKRKVAFGMHAINSVTNPATIPFII